MPAEQLEIAVAEEKKNKLLGRTELKLQVKHIGQPTPTRQVLRAEVGRISKAAAESVYVRRIVTDYGAGISECIVNVYDTPKLAEVIESEYIRKRNAEPEAKKESAPSKQQAPPVATPETLTPEAASQALSKPESTSGAAKPQAPKTTKKKLPKEKSAEGEAATPPSEKKES